MVEKTWGQKHQAEAEAEADTGAKVSDTTVTYASAISTVDIYL